MSDTAGSERSTWNEPGAPELLTVAEAAAFLGVTERRLRRLLALPAYSAQTRRETRRKLGETRRTKSGPGSVTVLPADLLAELAALFAADPEIRNPENTPKDPHQTDPGETRRETRREPGADSARLGADSARTPAGQGVPPLHTEQEDHQDDTQEAESEIKTGPEAPEEERWQEHRQNADTNTDRTWTEPGTSPFTTSALVPVYERLIAEKDARIDDLQKALEAERAARLEAAQALTREQTLRAYALPAATATDTEGAPIGTNTDTLREAELRELVRLQQAKLDELETQQTRRPWWAWLQRGRA